MTEKLQRIETLLRSGHYDSIILGITAALMTCTYEECSQIIPYYYAVNEPIARIRCPYHNGVVRNWPDEKDHIYIKGDTAIAVVMEVVFCRPIDSIKKLSYFDKLPKTYF